jgi:ATP-binding protein involved in chromosome partitioning
MIGPMSETLTRESVLAALKAVVHPELQRDVVSLGLVKDLTVDGGRVSATLEMMTHGSPYGGQMRDQVIAAVRALPGVTDAAITLQP